MPAVGGAVGHHVRAAEYAHAVLCRLEHGACARSVGEKPVQRRNGAHERLDNKGVPCRERGDRLLHACAGRERAGERKPRLHRRAPCGRALRIVRPLAEIELPARQPALVHAVVQNGYGQGERPHARNRIFCGHGLPHPLAEAQGDLLPARQKEDAAARVKAVEIEIPAEKAQPLLALPHESAAPCKKDGCAARPRPFRLPFLFGLPCPRTQRLPCTRARRFHAAPAVLLPARRAVCAPYPLCPAPAVRAPYPFRLLAILFHFPSSCGNARTGSLRRKRKNMPRPRRLPRAR